jgi:uncharacterized protein YndB with AHSA1/START domain
MGVLEYAVQIRADPGAVWSVYVDPRRIPEWQAGSPVIEDVRGSGDLPGSSYVSRRHPGTARTTVVSADRPRRLETRTEAALGLRFTVVSALQAVDEGMRLHLRVVTRWPRGLGLVGKIVERALLSRREAGKELARPRALIEGAEATTAL